MNFKLIIISSPTVIPNETESIISLFKNGLKIFHLRKPGMGERKMKEYISNIPKKHHARIVLHSNYSLVKQFDLKGIHLTEKERKKNTERVKNKYFSTGFHLNGDILNFNKYDSVFLSPVFDSIGKKEYKSGMGFSDLKKFVKKYQAAKGKKANLITLGGISDKNILKIKKAGFDGAAVLGAIWMSKDPLKSFLKIKERCR